MSNDSQLKVIKSNKKIFRFWLIFAIVLSLIPTFVIFYLRKDKPDLQNTNTFYTGLVTVIIAFMMILSRIRVSGRGKNVSTKGDLSKNSWDKALIDLVGIGVLIEVLSIWWDKASYLLILIPVYLVYILIKKVMAIARGF